MYDVHLKDSVLQYCSFKPGKTQLNLVTEQNKLFHVFHNEGGSMHKSVLEFRVAAFRPWQTFKRSSGWSW